MWVFLPSVRNVGWFTTACLKIAEQRLFHIFASFRMRGLYRGKSNNVLVVTGRKSRYRSVLSRSRQFCLALPLGPTTRLCFLYVFCCDALHLKKKYFSEIFYVHTLQPSVEANFNFNQEGTRMRCSEAHPQSWIRPKS